MSFYNQIKRVIMGSPKPATINIPRHGSSKLHHLYVNFAGSHDPVSIAGSDADEILAIFHALTNGMKTKSLLIQEFSGVKTVIDCRKITTIRMQNAE